MSNIGKQPISLPDSVKISISGNLVEVKGQLGELTLNFDSRIDILSKDNSIVVSESLMIEKIKNYWLISCFDSEYGNGVSIGFEKNYY